MKNHHFVCNYEHHEFHIENIDPSEYSMVNLLVDIWNDAAKVNLTVAWNIKVACDIPGSCVQLPLDSDRDIMAMFKLYESAEVIHLCIEDLDNPTPLLKSAKEFCVHLKEKHCDLNGNGNIEDEVVVSYPNTANYLVPIGDYLTISSDDGWDPECEDDIKSSSSEGTWVALDNLSDDEDKEDDNFVVANDVIGHDEDNWSDEFTNASKEDFDTPVYIKNGKWYSNEVNGEIRLQVGHLFENKNKFLDVLHSYAIQEGFALNKKKNLKKKFSATCKDLPPACAPEEDDCSKDIVWEPCPWKIYASLLPDGITYQIKTLTNRHSCIRLDKNPTVKATWVAEMLAVDFKACPSMDIKSMKELMSFKFGVRIGKSMLYRAKGIMKESIEGSHKDSYARLPTYIKLIMEKDPKSITGITWTRPENPQANPLFKKIFISFESMQQGFVNGCMPFIGVDGTHLKGKFGGTLLVACALDEDNEIFPLACAVVDKETAETWEFFFYHLKRMAPQEERRRWIICSDRQKGVESALASVLPEVSRRICARHLYANFKQEWPGDLYKSCFWIATKAHNEFVFTKSMEKIKKNSVDAYNYLMAVPLELWARHKFDKLVKVGDVTNNFVESFNGSIRGLRGLPILSMLEGLRRKCMKKMQKKKIALTKWNSSISPKARKLCDWAWNDGYYCIPTLAGEGLYEVRDDTHYHSVNLREWTCDCESWQNLGIPCKHAASAIRHTRGKLE